MDSSDTAEALSFSVRSGARAGRTGEVVAADPESHEGDKDAGDTRAIGITLGPFAPVDVVWIELPSSKGFGGVGEELEGTVLVAERTRDCESRLISLWFDEVNTLTVSGSEGNGG
jgi:hypothetical protein